MNQEIKNKTANAIKHTLIFKTLSQLCGVIATVLLVRALSENDYGIYNLLYSVIGLIGTVASLGIGNALQRYIPEYYQKGEFKIAHNLCRMTSAIRLITDAAILCFILLLWQEIAPVLKITEYKAYFMLFTLVIVLHQQRSMLETCLSSYFLHKYSKSIGLIFSMIKAVGYGLIIMFDNNLWYAIIIDLLAYVIVFASLQVLYFNKIPVSTGSMDFFTKQERKRVIRYALFYNFNDTGVGLLNANFDNFIIVIFLNPVAVGAYSFCVQLTYQITSLFPLKYLKDVIKPAIFSMGMSSNDKNDSTFFFQSLVKINSLFAIPCFFFLLIYSDNIIAVLFNNKFIEYASVLCGIFFFAILNSFPFGTIAQLRERADIILYSKIFAVYNLIAAVILIKMFGIWGAVFATGTATMAKNCFIWYFVKDDASFKGMRPFFAKIVLFWMTIYIAIHSISMIIPFNDLYQLFFGILVFSAAFFIQFKCNYFKNYEKKIMADLSNRNPKLTILLKKLKMLPDVENYNGT
jgi:O-antigen/teichoic acid export membrane protein